MGRGGLIRTCCCGSIAQSGPGTRGKAPVHQMATPSLFGMNARIKQVSLINGEPVCERNGRVSQFSLNLGRACAQSFKHAGSLPVLPPAPILQREAPANPSEPSDSSVETSRECLADARSSNSSFRGEPPRHVATTSASLAARPLCTPLLRKHHWAGNDAGYDRTSDRTSAVQWLLNLVRTFSGNPAPSRISTGTPPCVAFAERFARAEWNPD